MNCIIKKVVTVIACTSIVAGCAMVSKADDPKLKSQEINCSISNKGYKKFFSYSDKGMHDYYTYYYSVSYIHYSGCATGAYLPNLTVKVNSKDYICYVNTKKAQGPCHVSSPRDQNYRVHNNTGKDVSIKMEFSIGQYY